MHSSALLVAVWRGGECIRGLSGEGWAQMAGAEPGMTISGLSDTGVSPGRRFQPLILGLAVAIWALTHSTGHDSRDPSGLTLARQPGHSSACCGDAGGRL